MEPRNYYIQTPGLFLLFAITSAIPAAAQGGTSPSGGKATPVSINLSWVPTTANQLPFFLAKARGMYTAEGLDVTLVPGRGSALTAQTVGAGQYDIAQADLTTMALLRAKGAPLKAFLVQFPRTSFGCVGARDANIATWRDLEGKKVGVTQGAPETYLLPATFKKLGLNLDKVQRVNVAAPNKNTSFLSKLVDALCTDVASELPLLNPQRPLNPLWFGEVLDVPYHGVFTREEFIKSKPEIVKGVARAVAAATKAMGSDQKVVEEAAQALVQINPPGSLHIANLVAAWNLYDRFQTSSSTKDLPPGSMSRTDWQRTLELLREYASFDGSMNADDYFTNEFVPK
jgi:NitT/TauT family transport system substrate-binding protein